MAFLSNSSPSVKPAKRVISPSFQLLLLFVPSPPCKHKQTSSSPSNQTHVATNKKALSSQITMLLLFKWKNSTLPRKSRPSREENDL
jgi:hypothetical protein